MTRPTICRSILQGSQAGAAVPRRKFAAQLVWYDGYEHLHLSAKMAVFGVDRVQGMRKLLAGFTASEPSIATYPKTYGIIETDAEARGWVQRKFSPRHISHARDGTGINEVASRCC